MSANILVTGGAGAIGSSLVNRLSDNPANNVAVLDNLSSGYVANIILRPNVTFIQGSVESEEDLDHVFREPIHTVFHLAANFANQNSVDFPQRDLQINGMGTLRLLLRANRHHLKKFIYTSSSCVYGNRNEPLDEMCKEFSLDTPYGITKLLGEQYVKFFHVHHNMPTVTLRYFNVYGPNEYPGKYRNVIAILFFKAMNNEEIVITGTGEETRDFNFVDDAVRATILASQCPAAVGNVLNIASGRETKIIDLVRLIIEISGSKSKVVYGERRAWDSVVRRVASTQLASNVLGYESSVPLEDGLAQYYQWLQKQDFVQCKW